MDNSPGTAPDVRDPSVGRGSKDRQVLRAWALLLGGFTVLLILLAFGAQNVRSYLTDATQPRTGTLEPVSGQSLMIRSSEQEDWRLVNDGVSVEEGDMIATGSATTGWITLFDRGTIEVSENTLLRINRMRTSRIVRERKEVDIEAIRGSIYVGMAPRGEFSASELTVRSGPVTARMHDEIGGEQRGSLLVEAQRVDPSGDENSGLLSVRVAALRGRADVIANDDRRTLTANQQIVADASGEVGEITPAHRELIRNGDFERHLADWVEYHDYAGDGAGVSGSVERIPVDRSDEYSVALQIARATEEGDSWDTGVRQTVNQSLRVHSSLHLSLSLRIDEQQPPGGGDAMTEFPLIIKINYVDVQGQDQTWWHGFYILDNPANPVPQDRATQVPRGAWVDISRELRELEPLPHRISSVVVYGSGHSYRSLVSDLSLTSSETGNEHYD